MGIRIEKYNSRYFDEWNAFNASAKTSLFMFDRNYMEYHSNRYKDHSLLFYNDDRLVSILPANEKNHVLYSHGGLTYGGFITNNRMNQVLMLNCFNALSKYCCMHNIVKIIYKAIPYIYDSNPAGEDRYALFREGARIIITEPSTVMCLRNPIKMEKLRRRQINKARKNGVVVKKSSTKEEFDKYMEIVNEVLGKYHQTKAVHTADEIFSLYSSFPENIHLYSAWYNREMVAGSVIFEYDNMIHTQYLASNDTGRSLGALDITIKTIIDRYSSTKKYLDFGKSTENEGMYLNEGLIFQKEGFGGRTVTYDTYEWNIAEVGR